MLFFPCPWAGFFNSVRKAFLFCPPHDASHLRPRSKFIYSWTSNRPFFLLRSASLSPPTSASSSPGCHHRTFLYEPPRRKVLVFDPEVHSVNWACKNADPVTMMLVYGDLTTEILFDHQKVMAIMMKENV